MGQVSILEDIAERADDALIMDGSMSPDLRDIYLAPID
jgi:hypothetical protein